MPGRAAADHGGRGPKRLIRDPEYRARVDLADQYGLPVSELNEWDTADRDAAIGSRLLKAEECTGCGVHPSAWKPELGGHMNAVVPVWKHCRVCELIKAANDAGPPTEDGGWHLSLKHNH